MVITLYQSGYVGSIPVTFKYNTDNNKKVGYMQDEENIDIKYQRIIEENV